MCTIHASGSTRRNNEACFCALKIGAAFQQAKGVNKNRAFHVLNLPAAQYKALWSTPTTTKDM